MSTDKQSKTNRGRIVGLISILFFIMVLPVGCATLNVLNLQSDTNLLQHGITTRGVITDVRLDTCNKSSVVQNLTVRFTGQTGQVYTSTIDGCTYNTYNYSPGDSITIVYLPGNPDVLFPDGTIRIVPSADLPDRIRNNDLVGVTVSGIVLLIAIAIVILTLLNKVKTRRNHGQR